MPQTIMAEEVTAKDALDSFLAYEKLGYDARWGGIFVAPTSRLSMDEAVIAYGGGLSRIEGSFAAFNAIEIHQADGSGPVCRGWTVHVVTNREGRPIRPPAWFAELVESVD